MLEGPRLRKRIEERGTGGFFGSVLSLMKMPYGVAKQLQAVAFGSQAKSRPAGMLGRQDVPLRVRHQSRVPGRWGRTRRQRRPRSRLG